MTLQEKLTPPQWTPPKQQSAYYSDCRYGEESCLECTPLYFSHFTGEGNWCQISSNFLGDFHVGSGCTLALYLKSSGLETESLHEGLVVRSFKGGKSEYRQS